MLLWIFTYDCNTDENLKIKKNPKSGDLVAAVLTYYNEIHRAVILNKIVKEDAVHLFLCFFIDIGCKEYIKSNNIYQLEEGKNVSYFSYIFFSLN